MNNNSIHNNWQMSTTYTYVLNERRYSLGSNKIKKYIIIFIIYIENIHKQFIFNNYRRQIILRPSVW